MDFHTLLQPMEAAGFCREHWGKLPCAVSRCDSDYYSRLFSIADLDSLITLTSHASSPYKIRLVKSLDGELITKPVPHTEDGIPNIYYVYRSYYEEDYTITVDRLDLRWKPISVLCRNLENALHHPIAANLYFTPPHAQGFLPHFDTHDVFILQLEGSKLWRLYHPSATLPLGDAKSLPSRDGLGAHKQTVTLNAGDLLYIPRGYVHEAFTSEEPSLHLTLGIHVFRWADLITEAVVSVAEQDIRFREALPLGFLRDDGPPLNETLRQLLELLVGAAESEKAVGRIRQRLLSNGQPLPDGHFVALNQLANLNSDTVVRRRAGMICRVLVEDDRVSINFPGNIISGPSAIEPALRFITASEMFTVKDLPNCLSEDDKVILASRLVREGLLTME